MYKVLIFLYKNLFVGPYLKRLFSSSLISIAIFALFAFSNNPVLWAFYIYGAFVLRKALNE